MDDLQYVYHPTPAVNGGSICVGYPYSLLDWVPEAHQSWSLSVNVKRIPSQMTSSEMGVSQIMALSENRADLEDVLDIVATDAKYGNARFLRPLQEQKCAIVTNMRRDRVLYQKPEEPTKRKRGRSRVHGERFAFKEPETWVLPEEIIILEDDKFNIIGIDSFYPGKALTLRISHSNGQSEDISVNHSYNMNQISWFKAGSALNQIREQLNS